MWSSSEIKRHARGVLKSNYAQSITAFMAPGALIVTVCVIAELLCADGGFAGLPWTAGAALIVLADILLLGPVQVGTARFALRNRIQKAQMADLLFGFRSGYLHVVLVMMVVKLLVLPQMLLIVPGVINACRFRMVALILADAPHTRLKDVLGKSRRMMEGEIKQTLMLELSFAGWWVLSVLTGGVLCIFWSIPFYSQTCAELYAVNPEKPEGSSADPDDEESDDEESDDEEDETPDDAQTSDFGEELDFDWDMYGGEDSDFDSYMDSEEELDDRGEPDDTEEPDDAGEPDNEEEPYDEKEPEDAAPAVMKKPRRIQLRRAPSVEDEIPSGYDKKMETQSVPIMTEEEIVFQAALKSAEEEIRRYQRETADLLLKERGMSRESLENPSEGFLDETLTLPIDLELVEKALSDQEQS